MAAPDLTCEVGQRIDNDYSLLGVATMGVCQRFLLTPGDTVLEIDAFRPDSYIPNSYSNQRLCHDDGSAEFGLQPGINAVSVDLVCEVISETDNYED